MMSELSVEEPMTKAEPSFWYKGSFYMTDRYERADESSEKKAVEDAVPAPPNPTEDGPVEATSAVEVPTLPVETRPACCNLVETATIAQPAIRPRRPASLPAPTTPAGRQRNRPSSPTVPKPTAATGSTLPRQPRTPTQRKMEAERNPLLHVRSARRAARGGLPAVAPVGSTAHGRDDLGAAMLGCADPRGLATRPTCIQRSSGSCWTQRT